MGLPSATSSGPWGTRVGPRPKSVRGENCQKEETISITTLTLIKLSLPPLAKEYGIKSITLHFHDEAIKSNATPDVICKTDVFLLEVLNCHLTITHNFVFRLTFIVSSYHKTWFCWASTYQKTTDVSSHPFLICDGIFSSSRFNRNSHFLQLSSVFLFHGAK